MGRWCAYPFQARGETSTTSAAQTRRLDLGDDLHQSAQLYITKATAHHTQSWPLSRISLVLCQSPYFMALFRSAPWCPYKFWKILSWSFRPPYTLFGGASLTVARVLFCVCEGVAAVDRRVAAEAAGRARWAAALRADEAGACRASIVNAVMGLTGAIDARAAGERTWSL
jgi:hypothetical protein